MKKISITMLIFFCLCSTAWAETQPQNIQIAKKNNAHSLNQEVKQILNNYHVNSTPEKIEAGALKGMLESLDDPHSKYIDPQTFKNMQEQLESKTAQIGIEIGNRNNRIIVITVHPQSPAEKKGIKILDEITHIDAKAVAGKATLEIETMLLGEPNSRIDLTIRRLTTTKPVQLMLKRESFSIHPIQRQHIFYNTIGYIKLSSFIHPKTDEIFLNTLQAQQEQGIETLIVDLRNNSGGLLKHALAIASMFTDRGVITTIHKKNRPAQPLNARGNAIGKSLNLVVLINEGTASSAEILASSLRHHNNSTIIGTQSFGKASVQQLFPLQNGGALVCTIAKYKTAENKDISQKGLTPDYERRVSDHYIRISEQTYFKYQYETDEQLLAALNFARLNYR